MDDFQGEHLLAPLCKAWLGKIERAKEAKSAFNEQAEECMALLCDSHDFLWDKSHPSSLLGKKSKAQPPTFKMTVNKAHELRAIIGPVLYNRNPVRTVTPREPFVMPREVVVDPMLEMQLQQMAMNPAVATDPFVYQQAVQLQMVVQQQQMQYDQLAMQAQMEAVASGTRADLLQRYLNYTPNELGLANHFRDAIDEGLIKGMGIVLTECYTPRGSTRKLVGSFYRTIDDLLVDPDAEEWDDALWMSLRCVEPVWQVERDRGLPQGSLRPHATLESAESQGDSKSDWDEKDRRNRGETNDLIVYYKIWSKMGMGGRMSGTLKDLREPLETFGDYCYLEVSEGVPFLLNMPSAKLESSADEELMSMVEWPVPFHKDDRWPITPIWFYRKPRSIWPYPPLMPGIGYIKFLDWALSFLANRIKTTCRDFIAIGLGEANEIKDKIQHGPDQTFLEIPHGNGGIDNVIKILQHAEVNGDIWPIIQAVMEAFDKATGLNELLYGSTSRQMRSAAEAGVKAESISVRPDYMAGQVEQAASECARREALTIRWMLEAMDVQDILGPQGAQAWQMFVIDADVEKVARELDIRVEAGSARRPNRERDVDNINQILPTLIPVYQGYGMQTGNYQPFNALVTQWCAAIEKDPAGLMLPDVAMMPPPQPGQEEGNEENSQTQEQPA